MLYLAKISGERLQDHWSSGSFIVYICYMLRLVDKFCYIVYLNQIRWEIKYQMCLLLKKHIHILTIIPDM